MSRRTLLLVEIATVLGAAILLFADIAPVLLRVAVGLPFVLLLPGQAVMLLVDEDGRFGGLEWFALSVGLSVSVAISVGMVLAAASALDGNATVIALTVVTLVGLLAALARTETPFRRRMAPADHATIRRAVLGALALLACAAVVLLLSVPRASDTSDGRIVQLWGLRDGTGGLRIGARNVSAKSQRYQLDIRQGGRLIAQREMDLAIGRSLLFDVKRSATWTSNAPVVAVLTDQSGVVAPRTISVWTIE